MQLVISVNITDNVNIFTSLKCRLHFFQIFINMSLKINDIKQVFMVHKEINWRSY